MPGHDTPTDSAWANADDRWTLSSFRSDDDTPCDVPVDTLCELSDLDYVLVGRPWSPPDLDASDVVLPFRATRTYATLGLTEVRLEPAVAGAEAEDPWSRERAQAQLEAHVPGVLEVSAVYRNSAAWRSVAIGVDHLATVALAHRAGGADLIGGRERGAEHGYPALTRHATGWDLDLDDSLDWEAGRLVVPVLNLSCGPPNPEMPLTRHDLGHLAIRAAAAHDLLVVVAAGNCGRTGKGSVQPWARPATVLSVGASEDAGGMTLATYSGRGTPGDPDSGPDVIAYGASRIDERVVGTSFAAPRVAGMATVVTAAILVLRREVLVAQGAPLHGVPLVGAAVIDDFGGEIWGIAPRDLAIPALPVVGVDRAAVEEAVLVAARADVALSVTGTARLLRHLLLSFARPVDGYERHEVGAGFLDEQAVLDGLGTLTARGVMSWQAMTGPTPEVPPEIAARLEEVRIFDPDSLAALADAVGRSSVGIVYDRLTRRFAWQPRDGTGADLPLDTRINGMKVP